MFAECKNAMVHVMAYAVSTNVVTASLTANKLLTSSKATFNYTNIYCYSPDSTYFNETVSWIVGYQKASFQGLGKSEVRHSSHYIALQ